MLPMFCESARWTFHSSATSTSTQHRDGRRDRFTNLASRKRERNIMTASHVLCFSCNSIAVNFRRMMDTIRSISFGAIGRVRLCSRSRFTTWLVNSLHAWKQRQHAYTVSQKNKMSYSCRQLREILIAFQSLSLLDSVQNLLQNDQYKMPSHLKEIAALPCETIMFQLLASSGANILLKHNVKFAKCIKCINVSRPLCIHLFIGNSANNLHVL